MPTVSHSLTHLFGIILVLPFGILNTSNVLPMNSMKSIVSLSFPLSERPSLSILQVFVDPQQIFKNSQHTLLSPSGFTTNRVLLSVSCFFALRAKKLNPINLLLVDRDIISVFSRVKLWPVYYNLFHCSRSVISTFSWRRQKKLNFSIPPDYWKIGKKTALYM